MIELSTLQAVREIVTIVGVIAGLSYYVLTVQNATKARKTQVLMQLRDRATSKEWLKDFSELLESEWTDYDDYRRKYIATQNSDFYAKRYAMWEYLDGVGYLLHENLIDRESLYSLSQGMGAVVMWRKWKTIVEEQRKAYDYPDWWVWFEYLAEEMSKMRVERGHSPHVIDVDGYIKT